MTYGRCVAFVLVMVMVIAITVGIFCSVRYVNDPKVQAKSLENGERHRETILQQFANEFVGGVVYVKDPRTNMYYACRTECDFVIIPADQILRIPDKMVVVAQIEDKR